MKTHIESLHIDTDLTDFTSYAVNSRPPVIISGTASPPDLHKRGEIIAFLYFGDNRHERYAIKNFPSLEVYNEALTNVNNELGTLLPH